MRENICRLQLVGLQAAMICFVELEGLVPNTPYISVSNYYKS